MVIDFPNEAFQTIPHFKGGEGHLDAKMTSDDATRICVCRLEPGCTTGYHAHEENSEIIYVLSGTLRAEYDDTVEYVSAGQCHYCPMGHSHGCSNASDTDPVEMFCVIPEHHVSE